MALFQFPMGAVMSTPLMFRSMELAPKEQQPPVPINPFSEDGFHISLDVQNFKPEEITVKTIKNSVVVEGKHEEKEDEHGFITRHFVRRYMLPKNYDPEMVKSSLSSDGILMVEAPAPKETIEQDARTVPVEVTGPVRDEIKENIKQVIKDARCSKPCKISKMNGERRNGGS